MDEIEVSEDLAEQIAAFLLFWGPNTGDVSRFTVHTMNLVRASMAEGVNAAGKIVRTYFDAAGRPE